MRINRLTASLLIPMLSVSLAAPLPAETGAAGKDKDIVHALNRLGYGPRPGDVERVRAMGLEKWIEQQLHPERLEDPAPAKLLAGLKTIHMTPRELVESYELPRDVKRKFQEVRGKMEGASEEEMRKARREFMQENDVQLAGPPRQVVQELQTAKLLRAVHSERQLDEVLVDFWLNHFNVYADKGPIKYMVTQYERDVIRPHAWGRFEELLRATAESPAMLFYLDNYLSATPNASMDRPQARKPGGKGKAGMRGPGRGRGPRAAGGQMSEEETMQRRAPQGQGRRRGLNENYAREIMELHTLGVDGGYTQKDVTEVARCFTGWTIRDPRGGGGSEPVFEFNARMHDNGDKVVLGKTIKGNGRDEGLEVLHLLATHPKTARFIAYKLARRFVADEPPKALVDRATDTFQKTDGDIREVLKTIVTSPEFFAPDAREAKTKTPLEFVVSAVRASGATVSLEDGPQARRARRRQPMGEGAAPTVHDYLARMGMPLYLQQPPTGYKDTREAWESTSGLLTRLNFALDLTAGRIRGLDMDAEKLAPRAADVDSYVADAAEVLLPNGIGESTRTVVSREASGLDAPKIAGLLLGSPEFQRR